MPRPSLSGVILIYWLARFLVHWENASTYYSWDLLCFPFNSELKED